jgi:hypothetical protein
MTLPPIPEWNQGTSHTKRIVKWRGTAGLPFGKSRWFRTDSLAISIMEPVLPMTTSPPVVVLWSLIVAQVLGLVLVWLARAGEGTSREALHYRLALASLVLIGLAGMVTAAVVVSGMPGCWLGCGATLGLMLLAATWDAGRSKKTVVW